MARVFKTLGHARALQRKKQYHNNSCLNVLQLALEKVMPQ